MTEMGPGTSALLLSLFLTGLAGSLHCVGMCGPILLGFSKVIASQPGRDGAVGRSLDFALYHAGRLWTYGMLGLLAGWAGSGLRQGSALLGWQQPLAVVASVMVIGSGVVALGWIPGLRLDLSPPGGCFRTSPRKSWLAGFLGESRRSARLLLGAVMGLLPCGLVYAVLLVAATLPHPLLSAVGMVCFGVGTLPALSAVVLGGRLAPRWLRVRGTWVAAALLIGIGLFMLARTLLVPLASHSMH